MTESPHPAGFLEEPVLRILTLADHAVAHDDRFYVIGAGIQWYRPYALPGPIGQLYLAVLVTLHWSQAKEEHQLQIRWLDAEQNPIGADPLVLATVKVERPRHARDEDDLDVKLTVNLAGLLARAEEMTFFHVKFDGRELGRLQLRIRGSEQTERPMPPPMA